MIAWFRQYELSTLRKPYLIELITSAFFSKDTQINNVKDHVEKFRYTTDSYMRLYYLVAQRTTTMKLKRNQALALDAQQRLRG